MYIVQILITVCRKIYFQDKVLDVINKIGTCNREIRTLKKSQHYESKSFFSVFSLFGTLLVFLHCAL